MSCRVILVHGFAATPQLYWFPWLANELRERGIEVITPTLSKPFHPIANEWLAELHAAIGELDDNTIIVAHSLGNAAVMRFLQDAPSGTRCRAYIAVAPLVLERYGKLFPTFFEHAVDGVSVSAHAGSITVIHDPADHWAPISNAKFLQQSCGACLVEGHGRHHYNFLDREKPIPEILDAVLGAL